ncbi:MAG: YceI family protein [Bacteroidales bacterium]|nr:YceI family protein [Bacteroidales bacterium]
MKTKMLIMIIALLGISTMSYAQKYITKTGHIRFYSEAPLENIEAHNKQVNSAFNAETGDFVFRLLMKSFEFEKALMQEHFNENYVHSDKFPNATFVGKVVNAGDIDFDNKGEHEVVVKSELTIHGVTKEIETTGNFITGGEQITGESVFNIELDDYDVEIPGTVSNNISNTIEITVKVDLKKVE